MRLRFRGGSSVLRVSLGFAEERDFVAEGGEVHSIADLDALAFDAARQAPAALQLDDGKLIRYVVQVGLGRRVNHGLSVHGTGSRIGHAVSRILTTLVAPEPPRFCASPMECRATCRSPASPRICCTTSQIWPTPVAPTGCPFDFKPPLVFTGRSPLIQVLPASV